MSSADSARPMQAIFPHGRTVRRDRRACGPDCPRPRPTPPSRAACCQSRASSDLRSRPRPSASDIPPRQACGQRSSRESGPLEYRQGNAPHATRRARHDDRAAIRCLVFSCMRHTDMAAVNPAVPSTIESNSRARAAEGRLPAPGHRNSENPPSRDSPILLPVTRTRSPG